MDKWYQVKNENRIFTPSVLLYPERIRENIRRMISMAGNASRLRPHIKTHKIPQIVSMQLDAGITKFKCATLAEMVMLARTGAKDLLLAYPLVGPGVKYFCRLTEKYPGTCFSVTVENKAACQALEKVAGTKKTGVFIDIDNGMHRTGIKPGIEAVELAKYIHSSEILQLKGIHIYDGHIHEPDGERRKKLVEDGFRDVLDFISDLYAKGIQPGEIVCGGSPSFPVHALHQNRTLSPGTTLLWDEGYGSAFGDMMFLPAAVVATRIISKPAGKYLCFDLGHKALASEKPHPRVKFFGISDYKVENHSEEHLVISTDNHSAFSTGKVVYGIPMHICPTMALHDKIYVVDNMMVAGKWKVVARNRIY